MLDQDDTPTIRFAIQRRLSLEPGVRICDIKFEKYERGDPYCDPVNHLWAIADEPFIRVGLVAALGSSIITRSRFDLPVPFEHGHLIAEIDEIAEQYKEARRDVFTADLPVSEEKTVRGTGMRDRWARYGLRMLGMGDARSG